MGAQDELGYFYPNEKGLLKYTSLKKLIPKPDNSFNDVWNIYTYDNKVSLGLTPKYSSLPMAK